MAAMRSASAAAAGRQVTAFMPACCRGARSGQRSSGWPPALAAAAPRAEVVLLGSIASGKYVDVLLEVFGERLLFPETFVGRGDMSRGGLLLRAARSGEELTYRPIAGAIRRGQR